MTQQVEFSFSAECDADAATVMRLLEDVDGWPRWARPLLLHAQWERWGESDLAGPGAVRKLGAWPVWIREMILTRSSHGHTYTVISPAAFRHYLGTVEITDRPTGGVGIVWRIEFIARRAVMAPVLKAALQRTISGLLDKLVRVARQEGADR
ncbi:SRPBCC family protein [Mycolicibacterium litorale]|uniref:SRPBCC family protein n=1 Tax=Mycolicibacterium litorale TaxID=758802 RepID=UPI003CF13DCC